MMKSPFTEFVISLYEEGLPTEKIFEIAKSEFSKSTVGFHQVERAVENYKRKLINNLGEVIRHAD